MKPPVTLLKQREKNAEIRIAFAAILKAAKALLATIEEEPLRYTLTRIERHPITKAVILHDLCSPLLYLRLELHDTNDLSIHFGYECSPSFGSYYPISASFIRLVYRLTMKSNTKLNIEDAVKTDWIVNDCSDAYEYLEENGCKHHTFHLIKYKPKPVKRNLMRVA